MMFVFSEREVLWAAAFRRALLWLSSADEGDDAVLLVEFKFRSWEDNAVVELDSIVGIPEQRWTDERTRRRYDKL